ncbi:hypothetical protein C8R47DRAFT_306061 [Mycena vitilis]|nr:hypothetical protein C8R47DRAFT_306061 [Mycena vitilis]
MRLLARLCLFFVLSIVSLAAPLIQDGRPKRKVPQDTESDLRTPFATVADTPTTISFLTTTLHSKPVETAHAPAVADGSPQSSTEAVSRTIPEDDANITDTPATSRKSEVHSDARTTTDPTREHDTQTQETPFATPTSSIHAQAPAVGEKLPHSTTQVR